MKNLTTDARVVPDNQDISFTEKLMAVLDEFGDKVDVQYLCSAPSAQMSGSDRKQKQQVSVELLSNASAL